MDETLRSDIVERLRALVLSVAPEASFVEKYGGLVIESSPGRTATQFCGIFAYKKHVSLEFSNGAHLTDHEKVLEGEGKYRRHIKLRELSDIGEKRCKDYLLMACRL